MPTPKRPWRGLVANFNPWKGEDGTAEFHVNCTILEGSHPGKQVIGVIDQTLTAKFLAKALLRWIAERNDYGPEFTDLVNLVMDYTPGPKDMTNVRYLPFVE